MSQYPHIFVTTPPKTLPCKGSGFGSIKTPRRNKTIHADMLKAAFDHAWDQNTSQTVAQSVVSIPTKEGMYLEVRGALGHDLATERLGNLSDGCKLLSVNTITENEKELTTATLFVPDKGRTKLLDKIEKYKTGFTKSGNPQHNDLMSSIEEMSIAVMQSFWTDSPADIPTQDPTWCEIWLIDDQNETAFTHFKEKASALEIEHSDAALHFPERTVALAKINQETFHTLLHYSPDIAECRLFRESSEFFTDLQAYEQRAWTDNLLQNTTFNDDAKVSVCILDTGINNGHPLLKPVLKDTDMHTTFEDEGVADNNGHGTNMAGVATYGDLTGALANSNPIQISHCLESCKVRPKDDDLPPDLYGIVTTNAITQAQAQAPDRKRQVCMAVSAPSPFSEKGEPTSWSAAIDNLAAGITNEKKHLIIISAGNTPRDEWHLYPHSNKTHAVEDPAQAWNALTVGAYTNFTNTDEITALAPQGGLSPFSRTSTLWAPKWPSKPDVVFEGGNATHDGFTHEALSVLTTSKDIQRRLFTNFTATSAATAEAAWFAAQVQVAYPNAWPETVRALMVHSATWTEAMMVEFAPNKKKTELTTLKDICGYGVPSLERALYCQNSTLTLVAEQEIQPYFNEATQEKSMHMHLYDLPWPKEALQDLGETHVTMRVTLSYFIEPGPGQRGWKDKYRYTSHGLRFDVKGATETAKQFENRISHMIKAEDSEKQTTPDTSSRWTIGKNSQSSGSIHSDFWEGTAADLATCNQIAVYPVVGWWRKRTHLKKLKSKARYSLVVSLHTEAQDVDIYTPIATQIQTTLHTAIPAS